MSYDIIYNKQFVRLRKTGEVIPMLLAGSNNLYEVGSRGRNGRRVRSWDSFRYFNRKGKISEKPDVIMKKVDAELNQMIRRHRGDPEAKPADIKKRFGYYAALVVRSGHCADTSWADWRGVFSNGIRAAMTIEEMANLGVHLMFEYHYYGENPPQNGKPDSVPINTEKEYFIELKKWREWEAAVGKKCYLSFLPHDTDRVLEKLRSVRRRTPRERKRVDQDHFFVLSDAQNYCLRKYTSRGYHYVYNPDSARKFPTEKEAERYRQRLVKAGRYLADKWQVRRIERKWTFYL